MKYFLAVCVTVFFISCSAFSQQGKYLKHTVVKGETVTQIAQKYHVTPFDIYKLNPDSKNGVQPNTVLLIPSPTSKAKESALNSKAKTHQVATKETWYSIAKLYNVSIGDLEAANPIALKEGLKVGGMITIPSKSLSKSLDTKTGKVVYHEVLAKETKFSIAKKYGITIEQLEKLNPDTVGGLPVGYKLLISGTPPQSGVKVTKIEEPKKAKIVEYVNYEVKAKETMYSLTKMFGLSTEALVAINPELTDGVKEGMILKIPNTVSISKTEKNAIADLSKSITTQKRKELVLLLPFNISKLESDTINSTAARLKKDKFLNMTLDFYAGALMAIDSAKTLGLNINVKILDSQETKNSSNAASLVQQYKLENADAIIGPFYQTNVEKVAELVSKDNVPVISPLSKETVKSFPNLYQSMPTNDFLRTAMFDYLETKDGNIIAVIAAKKTAIKQYIIENQKGVRLTGLDSNGNFVADSLKKLLVKDKVNYVIMESEKTGTILAITNTLLNAMSEYRVQLVILEANPTLDFEEIPLSRLTKLKMLYPSLICDNETPEALMFENAYKRKNKIFPSQFATRGFDVTFDTMLRLSQNTSFAETIENVATKQVENKFDYNKKVSEGYTNSGVYILYYDADLTIKEAN
ncbi:LysM peptidoglycan-binding domain-containing protein [Flavobacterium sp. GT3R68]|uniref:LysM peptidoglycan-binding domain-containing protein n=1 Tax=Flavobacterium sp. GT3R68 TaxID=2594437 RepID=UPI000F872826|nr:LysM peptidoglycan-binding domain-containing protein [Flavobacterium sp. GT3R68]RTY95334.1 LysM peptidoglycan-binding domain-containing protein [Flavobacterium sp. GSN2]TRW90926.1 LysM peptidoglycan-binding domain-containing protein [Flavobacterium sp. GT3R68]